MGEAPTRPGPRAPRAPTKESVYPGLIMRVLPIAACGALVLLRAAQADAAEFLRDTFTDADGTTLASHDPDIGLAGSWALWGTTETASVVGDSLRATNASNRPVYRNSTTPGTVDYGVGTTAIFNSTTNDYRVTLFARVSASGSDYYYAEIRGDGDLELGKSVAGLTTTLKTGMITITAGTEYRIRLQAYDTQKTLLINGNVVLSDPDNTVTGAGTPGIGLRIGTSTTGLVLNEFYAMDSMPLGLAVSGFMAERDEMGARIRWTVEDPAGIATMRVVRRAKYAAVPIGAPIAPGETFSEHVVRDDAPSADSRYYLELAYLDNRIETIGPADEAHPPRAAGCVVATRGARPADALGPSVLLGLAALVAPLLRRARR